MKKFLTLAATAALGLGLISCGEDKTADNASDDKKTSTDSGASGGTMEMVSLKVEGMT